MPYDLKIMFTVAALCVAVGVSFINPNANNAGPDWLWRGGRNDAVRNAICRKDGTLRSHIKTVYVLLTAIFLMGIWLSP